MLGGLSVGVEVARAAWARVFWAELAGFGRREVEMRAVCGPGGLMGGPWVVRMGRDDVRVVPADCS